MSIPTSMSSGGLVPLRAGIRVAMYPSDPTFSLELQASTSTSFPSSRSRKLKFPPSLGNQVVVPIEYPYSTRLVYVRTRHFKLGYTAGPWTATISSTIGYLTNTMTHPANTATRISSLHNIQASIPPTTTGNALDYNSGGGTNGHMWICISLTSTTITLRRADGTTIVAGLSNGYDRPAAPTLSQVAGGALGARNYWARVAYVKQDAGQGTVVYRTSTETANFAVSANNLLKITAPTTVAGYDGWIPLIGTGASTEVFQGNIANGTAMIAFGTDFTEPVGGAATSSTTNTPYNSAMDSGFTVGELSASTSYKVYTWFDTTVGTGTGVIRIAMAGGLGTAASGQQAQQQNADGHLPFSIGPLNPSPQTPAAGGSGSGSNINPGRWL